MSAVTASATATINRACPSCGSADTASLQAIYEHGTSTSAGGVVGLVGDQLGIGGTVGSSMTEAGRRAAPPERQNVSEPLIMAGSMLVLLLVLALLAVRALIFGGVGLLLLPVYALAGAGLFWIMRRYLLAVRSRSTYNANDWLARHEQWSRRWGCRRCGATFEPTPR